MKPMQQNDGSPDVVALYAWISRDALGIEGIVAAPDPRTGTAMPLVMSDLDRARRMRPIAEEAARRRGYPAVLVRFVREHELESTDMA
jgi:hypothetical protein